MNYFFSIAVLLLVAGCRSELSTTGQLERFLNETGNTDSIQQQAFAETALSREEAQLATELIHNHLTDQLRAEYMQQWEDKMLVYGDHKMKYEYKKYGEKPADGWSLYISMHGGGNATQELNDRQWANQIDLYQPDEGIYMAPRSPDNSWNMWHKPHVDTLFGLFIQLADVFEDINTNRVYLTGYSAGGDGTYQLAPRMADRLAAAAMMAGHPNDASPVSLRNLPFAIHMGGDDAAYNRNGVAREWGDVLDELQQEDPEGYIHDVQIHEGLGHWMERRDTVAIEWMARFNRKAFPKKVVWDQNGKEHNRFYWLAVPENNEKYNATVIASVSGQMINIGEARNINKLVIYLNDEMVNLDEDVVVEYDDAILFNGRPKRTIAAVWESMKDRNDPQQAFCARIELTLN